MHVSPAEAKELYDDMIEQPKSAFWLEHDKSNDQWHISERRTIWLYPLNRQGQPISEKRKDATIDYDVCTCYDAERASDLLSMLRNRECYRKREATLPRSNPR